MDNRSNYAITTSNQLTYEHMYGIKSRTHGASQAHMVLVFQRKIHKLSAISILQTLYLCLNVTQFELRPHFVTLGILVIIRPLSSFVLTSTTPQSSLALINT